jgi:uncharacterized protein YjdB
MVENLNRIKQIVVILLLFLNSFSSPAQTVLTIEGSNINSAITGTWAGINIPRNQPTTFTYRNNSITSVNTSGYMLQAGDEAPGTSNNNLDYEVITGNKFKWNGSNGPSVITHGLFAGYNINSVVKYNYLENVPYGIIFKSGTDAGVNMSFTSGGCAYNISKNGKFAGRIKGINGVKFYNNTFYSGDGGGWYLLLITANMDRVVPAPSTGTKIFNNIFYSTIQIPMIKIESKCLSGFESDYNVYWCSAGEPTFNIDDVTVTWAQWRARGYDTHSLIVNPNFINTTDFVPAARLDYGKDLGTDWLAGLSTVASWVPGSSPATTNQNGAWQVGARIYSSQVVPVSSITVTGQGGVSSISIDDGTLQLSASVLPENATDKSVVWSIENGTGVATISSTGRVTAVANGTVTAKAKANDGSGVNGTIVINISNQIVPVSSISVSGTGGISTIATDNGSLQLNAAVLPSDATNKSVTWSLDNNTVLATIESNGIVHALDNGTVTARATANDGSGISGSFTITITKQVIPVTGISVSGAGGSAAISTDDGSLQLNASVLPGNATDKSVTWSVENNTGEALINTTGLLTAVKNGTVTARATSNDGSGISGMITITITNQIISVAGITISGAGGMTSITTDDGSLQLSESVFPANASDKSVIWSLVTGSDLASISSTGLVTALDNGTITVKATAHDGSGVYGTLVITISNQIVYVTGITINGAGGLTSITTDDGSLQLNAVVLPANATNKTVTWSVLNGTGEAIIESSGLVTAINNGTITAIASANDGTGIAGTFIITISNQIVLVTGITISGLGGVSTISTDNGQLQLSGDILPLNATNKSLAWSITNGEEFAAISSAGLVSARDNGTVTVRADATDGSGIYGSISITISNQVIPVTNISVSGSGGITIITNENGTLQLVAAVLPANATDNTVIWSVINGTGQASISPSGLVTAIVDGSVTAIATANDGSGVTGSIHVTISTTIIPVTSITVTGEGGSSTINIDNGRLQLSADVLPVNATNSAVTWSVQNGTGSADITPTGYVTAIENGEVSAIATANDGSGVFGSLLLTISNQVVPVTDIIVSGAGGSTSITTDNGSLQLYESVLPVEATNKAVVWSLTIGTGKATISSTGEVTAVEDGTVTATATATDGSGISGSLVLSLSNQIIPVISITVTGAHGISTITTDNGSLQLSALVLPLNASDKSITWSLVNGTGKAVISPSGLVTAIDNGTITATATANDGSSITGNLVVSISNQVIQVAGITVSGTDDVTIINTDDGSLQLVEKVFPIDASNKNVEWSIISGTSLATINSSGLLSALDNGSVTVRAAAMDGSGVYGTMVITITNQILPVSSITVTGSGGLTSISTDNGSLQLSAGIVPANATNSTITWSLVNGTGLGTISTTGRVSAVDNGTVTAIATANDGTGIYGSLVITISNQIISVSGITVAGTGGRDYIDADNGTLQLIASVLPSNATNKTVSWALLNITGQAFINSTGMLTALEDGTVSVRATANDGSGVSGAITITISNQIIQVTSISINGSGGASIITSDNGSLQLSATVLPDNAMNKTVTWSIINGSGQGIISASGLVTAIDNGTVTAIATANDGSGITASLTISIFNQFIPVASVGITVAGGSSSINTNNGSLQLNAAILPVNATDKTVTWSVVNGTGRATVSSSGLLTALDNGTVTVNATTNDGSVVFGSKVISISNQTGPVTSITITGAGGISYINTDNGSLQLITNILPSNATDNSVTWSFVEGSVLANINSSGLVTAIDNGVVNVRATAKDGTGVYGTISVTITNQIVSVTGINVTGTGGATVINTDNGTLQLSAEVLPSNVLNKTVSWSIENLTGKAVISTTGLVTAIEDGIVSASATANDGSGVTGTLVITISQQVVTVTGITITSVGGSAFIGSDNGSLQLRASIVPAGAFNKTVTWSIVNGTGEASINSSGIVTATDNGTVTALATSNDGSGVFGTFGITISGQIVPVEGISVNGSDGTTVLLAHDGSLQLIASVLPVNASNKNVTWSLANGTGKASLSSSGVVTAIENGTVTVTATANDGSGVFGSAIINISGQIVHVTGISVSGSQGANSITPDNKKLQLNATVFPSNATDKSVTWSIVNGTGLANINSTGLVIPIDNGNITAKATANDGSGIYGLIDIPIKIESSDLISIIVTRDEIKIQLSSKYISWKASLYNYQGDLVFSKNVDNETFIINISSIPSGLYLMVLSKGEYIKVAKVVKP